MTLDVHEPVVQISSDFDSKERSKKKIRSLRKKLKQIEELEEKINSCEIRADREQLEKISRKAEIQQELELLSH